MESFDVDALHGWVVQSVFPTQHSPGYQHTIGIWELCGHEFIVFGLAPRIGRTLLFMLGQWVKNGRRFAAGDVVEDLVEGSSVMLLEVADSRQHLTMANRLYRLDEPLPALQLVFADAENRWPWQPGSTVVDVPLLGPTPAQVVQRAASVGEPVTDAQALRAVADAFDHDSGRGWPKFQAVHGLHATYDPRIVLRWVGDWI